MQKKAVEDDLRIEKKNNDINNKDKTAQKSHESCIKNI